MESSEAIRRYEVLLQQLPSCCPHHTFVWMSLSLLPPTPSAPVLISVSHSTPLSEVRQLQCISLSLFLFSTPSFLYVVFIFFLFFFLRPDWASKEEYCIVKKKECNYLRSTVIKWEVLYRRNLSELLCHVMITLERNNWSLFYSMLLTIYIQSCSCKCSCKVFESFCSEREWKYS